MDYMYHKISGSFGMRENHSHSRRSRSSRYYDDEYDIHRTQTSSTATTSRSYDDDLYDIKTTSSAVEKLENLLSQMFEACAGNMKGMFDAPSSPCSRDSKDRRLVAGRSPRQYSDPYPESLNDGERPSKSEFAGVSQRKRGTRTFRRRSMSRPRRRNPSTDDAPLPGNNMTLFVHNDDDEVSALSAGTLEEMNHRQQRLKLLQEAKRRGTATRYKNTSTLQSSRDDHLDDAYSDGLQHNMEDLRSDSVSSANTTEFESIWNPQYPSNPTSTTENVGIFEKKGFIREEGKIDVTCNPIPEDSQIDGAFKSNNGQNEADCDTPLSRKLRRYQVKSGRKFDAIKEDESDIFSLQTDEGEI